MKYIIEVNDNGNIFYHNGKLTKLYGNSIYFVGTPNKEQAKRYVSYNIARKNMNNLIEKCDNIISNVIQIKEVEK